MERVLTGDSFGMTALPKTSATNRVAIRLLVYYAVLIGGGILVWDLLPHSGFVSPTSLEVLAGGGPVLGKGQAASLDEPTLAITVGVAMLASVLLALPIAWVYILTRAKRGYQQSVVQLLVMLPVTVSGVILLIKYSVALAFSLAGIVAAVRFRNTLDDSKDAVYVFMATAIGLAAAVNLPVALVISMGFNATAVALWYLDFGSAPTELDGRIAEKRLRRARQLARTGTFVARIDDEVFRNMSRDQLEGVAERAWRRAHESDGDGPPPIDELRVQLRTSDLASLRSKVEPKLEDYTKKWRMGAVNSVDGVEVVEYFVQLKKKTPPEELLSLLRAAGTQSVIDAELS
jgi:hypothetical protein